MAVKIKIWLVMLLTAALLAGCTGTADTVGTANGADTSAAAEDSENPADEIWSITGYYLRTNQSDMLISESNFTSQSGSTEIYYGPTIIYFENEETGEVSMDSLKSGDKIEVDVKLVMETYPGRAPIYALRFIEPGDISGINNETLLDLEKLGYHAVIGEKTGELMPERHSGYFVRTETDCFLVPSEQYGMLSEIDILEINPAPFVEEISLDGFNTGDRIWVDIMLIQELYPPIAPIYGAAFIEEGDISDIDPSVISKLEELGYTVV